MPTRSVLADVLLVLPVLPALLPAVQPQLSAPAGIERVLAGSRCETVLRRQLQDWEARLDRAIADPPGPTGERVIRLPTRVLGFWIRVSAAGSDELVIERISATRIERLDFDERCVAREAAVAPPPRTSDAYGDSDLIARTARGDRGVFLLWSPHMPLSVDQYAVVTAVGRDLDLAVVTLLDPGADRDYAARIVRERGLPADAIRPLGGVELIFRGMATHTPSLQVFAGGTLVGPVLFGYRSQAALRARLEQVLAGR